MRKFIKNWALVLVGTLVFGGGVAEASGKAGREDFLGVGEISSPPVTPVPAAAPEKARKFFGGSPAEELAAARQKANEANIAAAPLAAGYIASSVSSGSGAGGGAGSAAGPVGSTPSAAAAAAAAAPAKK